MAKQKTATPAAKRVTNVSVMRPYYDKNVIPNIGTIPNKELRRNFINEAMTKLGCTDPSAASMFNGIQKAAIAAGTVDATSVGRGLQQAAKEAEAGPDLTRTWARINKATRAVIETYDTRSAGQADKADDETVVKTATL